MLSSNLELELQNSPIYTWPTNGHVLQTMNWMWQYPLQSRHVRYSTDISADTRPIARVDTRPTLSADISAEISVDISADTRPTSRPILDRHLGRHSADISTDTRPTFADSVGQYSTDSVGRDLGRLFITTDHWHGLQKNSSCPKY